MSTQDYIPNTFQTPNKIIDVLMPLLTDSEFRVLLFMIRHIIGWEDSAKNRRAYISLSKFVGQKGYGSGCGLGRGTIIEALERLAKYRIIEKVGNPGKKGQLWELRLLTKGDPDIEGLHLRHIEKRQKAHDQTDTARVAAELKRSVEQTTKGSVQQTQGNPLFKPTNTRTSDSAPQETGAVSVLDDKPSNMQPTVELSSTLPSDEVNAGTSKTAENKAVSELIEAWLTEQKIIDSSAYRKTGYRTVARDLYRAGITPVNVQAFLCDRMKEPFWQGKTIPWGEVQKNITRWIERNNLPSRPRPLEPDELPEPDPVYPG